MWLSQDLVLMNWPCFSLPTPQLTCLYLYKSSSSKSSNRMVMEMQATITGVKKGSSSCLPWTSKRGGRRSEPAVAFEASPSASP